MSQRWVKAEYEIHVGMGATETRTLYMHHNNTVDYIIVYDHKYKPIMSWDDSGKHILFTIIDLWSMQYDDLGNLLNGVSLCTGDEIKAIETAQAAKYNNGWIKIETVADFPPNDTKLLQFVDRRTKEITTPLYWSWYLESSPKHVIEKFSYWQALPDFKPPIF